MKIGAALLLSVSLGTMLCACESGTTKTSSTTSTSVSSVVSSQAQTTVSSSPSSQTTSSSNVTPPKTSSSSSSASKVVSSQVVSQPEVNLEEAILKQPCYVQSTEYAVQDENYKNLYPDMLSAIIKNNSGTDIKDVTVAFAAWDKNNFPVKMVVKGYRSGYYVIECDADDANIVKGGTFGKDMGWELSSDTMNVAKLKAIVVSYKDFDGNTWTNPLYSKWKNTYENKKLS